LAHSEDIALSNKLTSREWAPDILEYSFVYKDRRIYLVEIPDFASYLGDGLLGLDKFSQWLMENGRTRVRFAGFLYLHRISDPRMSALTRQCLEISKRLWGHATWSSVILVSTHWASTAESVGTRREEALMTEFWLDMIEKGSIVQRHDGNRDSALHIVSIIVDRNMSVVLETQREMAAGLALEETTAGKYVAQQDKLDKDARERSYRERDDSDDDSFSGRGPRAQEEQEMITRPEFDLDHVALLAEGTHHPGTTRKARRTNLDATELPLSLDSENEMYFERKPSRKRSVSRPSILRRSMSTSISEPINMKLWRFEKAGDDWTHAIRKQIPASQKDLAKKAKSRSKNGTTLEQMQRMGPNRLSQVEDLVEKTSKQTGFRWEVAWMEEFKSGVSRNNKKDVRSFDAIIARANAKPRPRPLPVKKEKEFVEEQEAITGADTMDHSQNTRPTESLAQDVEEEVFIRVEENTRGRQRSSQDDGTLLSRRASQKARSPLVSFPTASPAPSDDSVDLPDRSDKDGRNKAREEDTARSLYPYELRETNERSEHHVDSEMRKERPGETRERKLYQR
jgi:hypothetical protein